MSFGKNSSVPAFLSKSFIFISNLGFFKNGRKQSFPKDDPFLLKKSSQKKKK